MRAEIVAVGTELLLGQIANTNAKELSERLAETGLDMLHHQVVGDNVERIAEAVELATGRADVVVLTGGLGPTGDDVTREGLANAFGVELETHPEIEDFLRERFRAFERDMPESNLRQAQVPAGARYILPERGTAPGLVLERDDGVVYAVPGVPAEMREMLEGTILPELRERAGESTIASRIIKTAGMAEAQVAELLDDLFEGSDNPTVAYLAGSGEVRVRLTAKAASRAKAMELIAPVEEEVHRRLGPAVYGSDDDLLEEVIGRMLQDRGWRLACAESLTGGALGARLTKIPGASLWFAGSAVCYTNEAKRRLLEVPEEILEGPGAVSEECARAMADGARRIYGAEVGVALTGVAGPEEQEGRPPGTVWVAVLGAGGEEVRKVVAPGDRDGVRRWAVQSGLILLRKRLLDA
ncbi:MAG TPA: competence/damage-inducible protein A [Actinomycetota bacterium]|nr:competence/damage-inducible protein A [Actinomycetota bacterium]